jgi:hypothetical protein
MKNISFFIVLFSLIFTSCEEVVDIDLQTAPPKLVVNASINWVKGTNGSVQKIKLTTTTGYYDTTIPVVSGATVFVTNSTNVIFNFAEATGTGEYICTNFVPQVNETYVLTIISNGETYTATEKLYGVPDIQNIVQNNNGGFLGDEIEVRFFFPDNALEDNYYLTRFDTDVIPFPEYEVFDDRFFEGNDNFGLFSNEDLKQGDVLNMKLYGVSERFFDYMTILLSVSNGGGGGPFQTPPATVKGNVVNQTNKSNIALGYFRLSEVSERSYTIQ